MLFHSTVYYIMPFMCKTHHIKHVGVMRMYTHQRKTGNLLENTLLCTMLFIGPFCRKYWDNNYSVWFCPSCWHTDMTCAYWNAFHLCNQNLYIVVKGLGKKRKVCNTFSRQSIQYLFRHLIKNKNVKHKVKVEEMARHHKK